MHQCTFAAAATQINSLVSLTEDYYY